MIKQQFDNQQQQNFALFKTYPELKQFPSTLSFYKIPPNCEITLREFEEYGLDRLTVLMAIESTLLRFKEDRLNMIDPILAKHMSMYRNTQVKQHGQETLVHQRRKDHISHFVLRLAYCKTSELQSWFVKYESILFKKRFLEATATEREWMLEEAQLELILVDSNAIFEEFKKYYRNMNRDISSYFHETLNNLYKDETKFYKVPFKQATELVAKKRVLLLGGYAYVAESEKVVLIVKQFSEHLKKELIKNARALPRMDEDDRIMPLLYSLAKQSLAKEYKFQSNTDEFTADDIPNLTRLFPPCMQQLQYRLEKDSHLKHQGRIQYGLFLKGIGLSLEEALLFWRKSFKNMSDDEFQKKGYAYNIRYNYGMEGKRANYTPYSCLKIIASPPGHNESHGCPFRYDSHESLEDMMIGMHIEKSGRDEVAKKAAEGHYQLACTRLFELSRHKKDPSFVLLEPIDHPNRWFDQARSFQ
jgi:DNA primase large subunit